MATLCILSVSPREALAQGDSLSSDLEITIKSQDGLVGMPSPAALIDSVLDTYSYFYCYSDASHDNPLMYPTYRTITFKKGVFEDLSRRVLVWSNAYVVSLSVKL